MLDDSNGVFDDDDFDHLILDGGGSAARIDLLILDPDLDDDGCVADIDIAILEACEGRERGSEGFDPRLDLDSSGRIDAADRAVLEPHLGAWALRDHVDRPRRKERKWSQPGLKKPEDVEDVYELYERDKERGEQEYEEKKARKEWEKEQDVHDLFKELREAYCPPK